MDEIEWMIVGGESGPGHRDLDLDWARNMQRACGLSGTAFFFKQNSGYTTEIGVDALGAIYRDYPLAWNREDRYEKVDITGFGDQKPKTINGMPNLDYKRTYDAPIPKRQRMLPV